MNKDFIQGKINEKVALVNDTLDKLLPGENDQPALIHQAMRYSMSAGGKRLRPVLVLASAEAAGGSQNLALPVACAIEMIHTYSLIHDDLPAMDNDDYRRGKLTNHKVFGESMAILAGDALLTLAFDLLSEAEFIGSIPSDQIVRVISEISKASGSKGMIGGQVVDILSENKIVDSNTMKYIHAHKTGALFRASIRTGAIIGGATEGQLNSLTDYAENLGIAFQITDDILDVEGETAKLGKTVGSDQRKNKSTYPSIFGLEESKDLAKKAVNDAISAIRNFDEQADTLRYLASYLLNREN